MMPFFPLRKIKRNGKFLFFGAVLVVASVAAYLEHVATSLWNRVGYSQQEAACAKLANRDHVSNEDIVWSSKYVPQPWKPEYKGQANLHVFEDWCGTSIASLRKNPHYPLYPHSRITVKKLAVSPSWNNYGLRIFGYIHPSTSGVFLFAVASKDNCEFWLSHDENPENLQLLAHVGKTGEEWTAPGEYGKYSSQISKPVVLQQQKRFYFELIHKYNDHGTGHVEVAWRLNKAGMQFELIDSASLSLYTIESSLQMGDVSHIPQTAASHVALRLEKARAAHHGAEMLREDPRDTFFKMPLLDKSRLQSVLPECSYKPSYTIKGRQIGRYQGLQFVHLSYIYPNDYTRLTHMESGNTCFYQMKPYYFKIYGFSWYMRLDQLEEKHTVFRDKGDYKAGWKEFRRQDEEMEDEEEFDYRDDYIQHQQRKLFSNSLTKKNMNRRRRANSHNINRIGTVQQENLARDNDSVSAKENQNKLQKQTKMADQNQNKLQNQTKMADQNQNKLQNKTKMADQNQNKLQNKTKMADQNQNKLQNQTKMADQNQNKLQNKTKMADQNQNKLQNQTKMADQNQNKLQNQTKMADQNQEKLQKQTKMADQNPEKLQKQNKMADQNPDKLQKQNKMADQNPEKLQKQNKMADQNPEKLQKQNKMADQNQEKLQKQNKMADQNPEKLQKQNKMADQNQDKLQKQNKMAYKNQQFRRKDKIPDQKPNSGTRNIFLSTPKHKNPQPHEDDSISQKHRHGIVHRDKHTNPPPVHTSSSALGKGGDFVNSDGAKTHKELTKDSTDLWVMYGDSEMETGTMSKTKYDPEIRWDQTFQVGQTDFQTLRTDWIDLNCNVSGNLLISQSEVTALVQVFMEKLELKYPRQFSLQRVVNVVKRVDEGRGNRYLLELDLLEASGARVRLVHYVYLMMRGNVQRLLCNPSSFLWNPNATIHIIIPVKNQARWVQKFIMDMEELHEATGDNNVNIIITDYSSTDMDIEQALKNSRLPKSQYLRLTGNFERSAGLQAGINLVTDNHSIVFLCDLHLHFPLSFFDSVRKHCVEGHMAFAPIVMRLNCGATPQEPDGYWEVNGFGLLGIYKSDLDAVGGMNTKEFTNRWGGEDWELLDRIMEAGLEVERLHLRNFFHYHHSRRGMWNLQTLHRK